VVWHGEDGDHEIYLWDGVAVQQITDNTEEDRYPQISDDGQVAWLGEDAVRPTVILWNGGVAQKLASSSSKDDRPRMNSAGQVTWQGYVGTDWEIHLWDGSAVRQLTASENGRNEQPHLNDVGHVVWKGPGRVISLWDGSVVRPLTPDARTGYQPRSNNSDEVVWWTEEGSLLQLLLWDGMGTRVIATATSLDPNYQINGDGQVVWVGTIGGNLGLYLYTPDPPAAPLQLTATVDSPTQVTLSWSDASDNETAFQIWRKIGDGEFAPCGESPANTTSAVDATLSPNTHYLYQVRAVGRRAMSDWSNTVEVTTPPPPPGIAPTDLQATTVSARQIRLTWTDNSTDERAFVIWRQAGSGEFKPYRRTRANVTAFLDRNLRPNTTYGYMVRAEHRTAVSDWSDPTSATTLPLPPAKPGAPIAMATSATQIVLRWTDRSSNETEFSIWRQVGTGAFTPYGTVGANEVSFVDPSVLPNTRYRYRVRAVNTGGSSAFSRTATAVTPGSAGTASRTRRLTPAGTSARRSRR
jgi:fibronectin type 3 domain-containing protein